MEDTDTRLQDGTIDLGAGIEFDPADKEHPINIGEEEDCCCGWLPLHDAREMHVALGKAIAMADAKWPELKARFEQTDHT